MNDLIIYGAYGYTGKLIVELAVEKGWKPTVAGRNHELIKALAEQYDLPYLCFDFDNQQAWDKALSDHSVLLNCAGPFALTIHEILPACLRNKTHYTDITGEIKVFEFIQEHHAEAQKAGVIMMPGVGFDVVPTDCLAKYLYEQLPTATHLELAFDSSSGLSRGTALSLLNRFHLGYATRKGGVIDWGPEATESKVISYGGKDRFMVGITWGDVFTAFYTTGIPNIKVYTGMPEKTMKMMRLAGKWTRLIKTPFIQRLGRYFIKKNITGPDKEKRDKMRCYLWGKVTDERGNSMVAEMETPESYRLTAHTALLCVEKVKAGEPQPGFHTPAGAFGSDLIIKLDGVTRERL